MSDLVVARDTGEGRFAVEQREITDRLRNGDATLGWEGDPELNLIRNCVDNRWEVWRHCTDGGEDALVMWTDDRLGTGDSLIRACADHDTHHVDVVGNVFAARAQKVRDDERALDESNREHGDRLAHALAKDLSLPAVGGKVYPLR